MCQSKYIFLPRVLLELEGRRNNEFLLITWRLQDAGIYFNKAQTNCKKEPKTNALISPAYGNYRFKRLFP